MCEYQHRRFSPGHPKYVTTFRQLCKEARFLDTIKKHVVVQIFPRRWLKGAEGMTGVNKPPNCVHIASLENSKKNCWSNGYCYSFVCIKCWCRGSGVWCSWLHFLHPYTFVSCFLIWGEMSHSMGQVISLQGVRCHRLRCSSPRNLKQSWHPFSLAHKHFYSCSSQLCSWGLKENVVKPWRLLWVLDIFHKMFKEIDSVILSSTLRDLLLLCCWVVWWWRDSKHVPEERGSQGGYCSLWLRQH